MSLDVLTILVSILQAIVEAEFCSVTVFGRVYSGSSELSAVCSSTSTGMDVRKAIRTCFLLHVLSHSIPIIIYPMIFLMNAEPPYHRDI